MNPLIQISHVSKQFTRNDFKALDDVTLEIHEGETLGIVGESGSGKSTLGKILVSLESPTSGEVIFNDLFQKQMIFQDPYSSLNPKMTLEDILKEPFIIHKHQKSEIGDQINELLSLVGLNQSFKNRFPHQLSGGQRQRIGIARALSLKPKFIVCDEPTSALDVSVRAQILNLLIELQRQFQLTYLFISHEIGMVHYISSRIGVIYFGQIVEMGDADSICKNPLHPYTQALISSLQIPDPILERARPKIILKGDPLRNSTGCPFQARCPHKIPLCKTRPPLKEISPSHHVACWLHFR